MDYASVIQSGGILAEIRRAMQASTASIDSLVTLPGADVRTRRDDGSSNPPDPYAGQAKWPAWKVTVAVVVFCGAFWTGVGYIALRLFG
jgi:hypothetical protein